MKQSLMPPGSTEKVWAKSVLVLAPHFDDEVLGCGGLISTLAEAGSVVRVLFLSNGEGGVEAIDDRAVYGRRRRLEAKAAVEELGLQGFDQLSLPDGALEHHLEALAEGIQRALLSQRPDLVLVTSPLEVSADHRAAFRALHDVLGAWRGGEPFDNLTVLAYEVNHPLYPNCLVDVSTKIGVLERAMAHYRSQQERHDYLGACLGLRRYRALSLGPEIEAVEAYRRLHLTDFITHGPSRLIAELGGQPELLRIEEGPLVSVIVRTKDRPQHLAEALASLGMSTYGRAEVIVVNDGGVRPSIPEDYPLALRLIDLEKNRGRAGAANAGVEAAQGDYIGFLDDDDLVEPEHLATLVGLVHGAGVRVAYTDAAVGVYETDAERGWKCIERRLPYSRDFDPELLLCDNYIPFHTLLIERSLFAEVEGIDPAFDFFEDWDFLIRLASRTPFQHLARVTCEYRHFRGSGHHILGERPRQRSDFLVNKSRVLRKHSARLTPEVVARVIDGLRAESIQHQDAAERWREESRLLEQRSHTLNGELSHLKSYTQVLETSRHRAESESSQFRAQLHERDREVQRLYGREQDLITRVEEQTGTLEEQFQKLAEFYEVSERQTAELQRLHDREEELSRHEATLLQSLEKQGVELERVYQQERDLNDHLGKTYAEIERLNQQIETMKQTRGWRLQEWWEKRRR